MTWNILQKTNGIGSKSNILEGFKAEIAFRHEKKEPEISGRCLHSPSPDLQVVWMCTFFSARCSHYTFSGELPCTRFSSNSWYRGFYDNSDLCQTLQVNKRQPDYKSDINASLTNLNLRTIRAWWDLPWRPKYQNTDSHTLIFRSAPHVTPLSIRTFVRKKIWINYIQAYMPHESSEDSSNQPDGPKGSLRCPLDPLPGGPWGHQGDV